MPLKIRRALLAISDPTGLAVLADILKRWHIEALAIAQNLPLLGDAGISARTIPMDGMQSDDGYELLVAPLPPLTGLPIIGGMTGEAGAIAPSEKEILSLIRGAAYRHKQVATVSDSAQYATLAIEAERGQGALSEDFRRVLAADALLAAACCDAAYAQSLNARVAEERSTLPQILLRPAVKRADLTPGIALYADLLALHRGLPSLASAVQIQGDALTFPLLRDADLALRTVRDVSEPSCAVVATGKILRQGSGVTLDAALAAGMPDLTLEDLTIACNRPIYAEAARMIAELDVAMLVAPDADIAARTQLGGRARLRVLLTRTVPLAQDGAGLWAIDGGFLMASPVIHALEERL